MIHNMQRVMVIAPHADDESFGCGGLLSKLSNWNREIKLILCSSSAVKHRDGVEVMGRTRIDEFEAVAMQLKAKLDCYKFYDTKLKEVRSDLIHRLEYSINDFRADTVLFPYTSFHQDHQAVYESMFAVLRPGRCKTVKVSMCYEVPNYIWYEENRMFIPNWYLRMGDQLLQNKLELCNLHKSQVSRIGSPIVLETVRDGAKRRGFEIGCKYAEAFRIIRGVE